MGYYRRLPVGPDAFAAGLSQQFLYDPAEIGRSSFCGWQGAAGELLSVDDDAWDDHDLFCVDGGAERNFREFSDPVASWSKGYGVAVH